MRKSKFIVSVAPAFRCETGREEAVVRVIQVRLTLRYVYSVTMLGLGLSKTAMNHNHKWFRVKLKLNQVAKLQKGSVSKLSPCTRRVPDLKLRHDGMRTPSKRLTRRYRKVRRDFITYEIPLHKKVAPEGPIQTRHLVVDIYLFFITNRVRCEHSKH